MGPLLAFYCIICYAFMIGFFSTDSWYSEKQGQDSMPKIFLILAPILIWFIFGAYICDKLNKEDANRYNLLDDYMDQLEDLERMAKNRTSCCNGNCSKESEEHPEEETIKK